MKIQGLGAVMRVVNALEVVGATKTNYEEEPDMWEVNLPHDVMNKAEYSYDEPSMLLCVRILPEELVFEDEQVYALASMYVIDQDLNRFARGIEQLSTKRLSDWVQELAAEEAEWRRERARMAGMGMGIEAYNDHMGYGGSDGED